LIEQVNHHIAGTAVTDVNSETPAWFGQLAHLPRSSEQPKGLPNGTRFVMGLLSLASTLVRPTMQQTWLKGWSWQRYVYV